MVEVKLIERGVFGVVGHKLAENDCMLSADPCAYRLPAEFRSQWLSPDSNWI